MTDTPRYHPGFGNHVSTEAVPGALPIGRNSPQHVPFGLYAEQLSGTAFTAPRHENRRSWLYRMRPTAEHPPFRAYEGAKRFAPGTSDAPLAPNRRYSTCARLLSVRFRPRPPSTLATARSCWAPLPPRLRHRSKRPCSTKRFASCSKALSMRASRPSRPATQPRAAIRVAYPISR